MKNSKGFTLIEVLLVVAIVGVISFIGFNALRGTYRVKSREVTWRMTSVIKYLYNYSVSQNKTTRLVLDLGENTYWAESTSDRFLLEDRATAEAKKLGIDKKEEPAEEEKKEETPPPTAEGEEGEGEGAPAEDVPVEPIEATFGAMEDIVLDVKPLPGGVLIKDVWTPHDAEVVESGKAFIYFFPNGSAERAIVNFKNEADDKHVSIRINPFNGTVDIAQEYRKPEGGDK